jgi:hypothetical protein
VTNISALVQRKYLLNEIISLIGPVTVPGIHLQTHQTLFTQCRVTSFRVPYTSSISSLIKWFITMFYSSWVCVMSLKLHLLSAERAIHSQIIYPWLWNSRLYKHFLISYIPHTNFNFSFSFKFERIVKASR